MSSRLRIFISAAFPIVIILLFIFSGEIIALAEGLPKCAIHLISGYYCPGCGNTRSVKCLIKGEFISAVRNNPLIPFLGIISILFYTENALALFGKGVKLVPRSAVFWWSVFGLFLAFYLLRNFIPQLAPM